jgi:Flp pilus assembly protein TadB
MGWRRPYLAAGIAAVLLIEPMIGAALAAVAVAWTHWQRAADGTRRKRIADADAAVFADLVVLGLTAGLSLRSAVEAAAYHVGEEVRRGTMRMAMDR